MTDGEALDLIADRILKGQKNYDADGTLTDIILILVQSGHLQYKK